MVMYVRVKSRRQTLCTAHIDRDLKRSKNTPSRRPKVRMSMPQQQMCPGRAASWQLRGELWMRKIAQKDNRNASLRLHTLVVNK